MKKQFKKHNQIIIIGDAGRGKSTLALKLSNKLGIKYYSTDDFFWKKKFTQEENKEISLNKILEIYKKEKWIVEGTTRRLLEAGLERADIIIYMKHNNSLYQLWILFKRYLTRRNEGLKDVLFLMKDVFYKRYGFGDKKRKITYHKMYQELVNPYRNKVMELHSFRAIDDFIKNL
jgi:adenylate kinase family enzyme